MPKVFPAAVAAALLLATPSLAQEERTYPQRLAGASPEATAEAFVDRLAARDYFAVFFLLTPEARDEFFTRFQVTFSLEQQFIGSDGAIPPGSVMHPDQPAGSETLGDRSLVFDNLLFHADEAGMLPFFFGDAAAVGAAQTSENTASVEVTTDGEPAEITLHLATTEAGAWLVDRMDWPGSDASVRPWGIAAQP